MVKVTKGRTESMIIDSPGSPYEIAQHTTTMMSQAAKILSSWWKREGRCLRKRRTTEQALMSTPSAETKMISRPKNHKRIIGGREGSLRRNKKLVIMYSVFFVNIKTLDAAVCQAQRITHHLNCIPLLRGCVNMYKHACLNDKKCLSE
jgi:hypothetical protein